MNTLFNLGKNQHFLPLNEICILECWAILDIKCFNRENNAGKRTCRAKAAEASFPEKFSLASSQIFEWIWLITGDNSFIS